MKLMRSMVVGILFMLIITFLTHVTEGADLNYISSPSNIPYLSVLNAPSSILPGNSDILSFTLKNRYSRQMENTTIKIEIYGAGLTSWLNPRPEYRTIAQISNPPEFEESVASRYANRQMYIYTIGTIKNNTCFEVKVRILTYRDTPDAVYFVRFNLTFSYENVTYVMLSRGYFSDEDWRQITSTGGNYSSRLNMDFIYKKYGAAGVLPDTVFMVRTPIPLWPFYLLFGAMCFFALLAAFTYLKEEKKVTFPFLEKRLYQWIGKSYEFRKFSKQKRRKPRLKI